jgi:flagellar motor protein MotB
VFAAAVSSKLPLLLQGEQQPLHFAAVVLHAYQQLQLQPPAAAVDALLAAAARQLGKLDLAAAAAHAAALPDQPAGKQQQRKQRQKHLWQRLQQQQQQQRPELLLDISMLLHSLAKLSYRPTQQFMGAIAAVAEDGAWHVVDCHDGLNALAEAWQSLQQQQQQQQGLSSSQAGQHHQQQQLGGSASVTAATASKQQQILLQRQQLLQELQSSMRGREVSPLLWAMGKLRYQAPKSMLRPVKMACWRQRAHCSAADVSVIFWALARMRHRPGYVWVGFMLEHFLIRIDDRVGGAADVCNVVHALPNLGGVNQCHPLREKVGTDALQGLADAAAARFSECGPREMRQLAVGFGRLGFKPAGAWMEQHQQRVQQLGRSAFSKREWRALQQAYQLLPVTAGAECVAVPVRR